MNAGQIRRQISADLATTADTLRAHLEKWPDRPAWEPPRAAALECVGILDDALCELTVRRPTAKVAAR